MLSWDLVTVWDGGVTSQGPDELWGCLVSALVSPALAVPFSHLSTDLVMLMGFAPPVTWGTSALLSMKTLFRVLGGQLCAVFHPPSGLQNTENPCSCAFAHTHGAVAVCSFRQVVFAKKQH